MFYNKELFINDEIKSEYKRYEKLLNVLVISIVVSFVVVWIAVLVTLGIKFRGEFKDGYAMAIFASVIFVVLFVLVLPFQKKFDVLRNKQTEDLKGQPIYEKYVELLNSGSKLNKITNYITLGATIISLILVWVLAVIYPHSFYVFFAFLIPLIVCDLILITRSKKISQIKLSENKILCQLYSNSEVNGGSVVEDNNTSDEKNKVNEQ